MVENARAATIQNPKMLRGPAKLLDLIGNTSLIRLARIRPAAPDVEVYAKAEWENPGGSVKDRPALNIIREAEAAGRMSRNKILIDSTSGNTGIAYAMICAARNYGVKLCMPSNVSMERKRILKAYGADIVYTDPMEGSDGAIRRVRILAQENPGLYFYANQYDNPANWRAHYLTTGPEIYEQTGGRVTHYVAGLGTSGTFIGTARRLKELNPAIQCLSFQPDSPFHGLEGMKHMATCDQAGDLRCGCGRRKPGNRDGRCPHHDPATGARRGPAGGGFLRCRHGGRTQGGESIDQRGGGDDFPRQWRQVFEREILGRRTVGDRVIG